MNLRQNAISRFGSVAGFARAIGWPLSKTEAAITGHRNLSAMDMEKAAKLLGINDSDSFMKAFFYNVDD